MNQQVLDIVIAQLTATRGDGCICMRHRICPDRWFHEATAMCSDCDTQTEIRLDHFDECAERCVARLMMTTGGPQSPVYPLSTRGHEVRARCNEMYAASLVVGEPDGEYGELGDWSD